MNGSWTVVPGWFVVGSSRIRTAPLPVAPSHLLVSSYQIASPSEAIVGPNAAQTMGIVAWRASVWASKRVTLQLLAFESTMSPGAQTEPAATLSVVVLG